MRRRFLAFVITVLIAVSFSCYIPAAADDNELPAIRRLNIATVNNRPLSIDRLLWLAFSEIGLQADVTAAASLQQGYTLANNGERNGVLSSTPDMESAYPNLVKVPVPLEDSSANVFIRADSKLKVDTWDDLSGLDVGILTQRVYIKDSIPESASVTVKDTTKQVLNGLADGEYDVAVLSQRGHETLNLPRDVIFSGTLETASEFLYLHKSLSDLIPSITGTLRRVFDDGRGEKILSDIQGCMGAQKKTVLHIISSNAEIAREARFKAKLNEPFKNDLSVEWYSIAFNSARYFDDASRLSHFAGLLRRDCVSRDIAAIVVSGEDALEFIKEYYFLFFRNVPVLFYDIGEDYETAIEDYTEYFTGIVERPSAYETASQALKLFPNAKKLYVINDYAAGGAKHRKTFEKQLQDIKGAEVVYNENESREMLLEQITQLSPDSLVLVGSYFLDYEGQYYSQNDMASFFDKNSPVPVFTTYSADLPYGAVGGKTRDYEKLGDMMAGMLKRILDGEDVTEIPIITNSGELDHWVFNKDKLDQWGVSERALPRNAEIVNKQPSILESNPKFVFSMASLIFLGIAIIIAMYEFLDKYRRQNSALLEVRESLHTAEELLIKDEKIREVKERLERIISTAPVSYVLSIDGKVVELNENMKSSVGLKIGDDIGIFLDDHDYYSGLVKRIAREKTITNEIMKVKFTNGEVHRCLANIAIVDFEQKKAVVTWAVDIEQTEREKDQIQTSWQNLRSIMDAMPVTACIVDLESWQILYGNNRYLDLMGIESQEDLQGINIEDTLIELQPDGMTSAEMVHFFTQSAVPLRKEAKVRVGDNKTVDVRISSCPIDYNGRKSMFCVMTDLTAEKESQRMLRNAAEKEKEANELKSRFMVNMSHEIRTPMNAIIGLTEIELRKNQLYETKEIYKKINSSAQNLLHIINDILDLSKVEANKMELHMEEFELEEVLNSAMLVASPRLDGKNVEFMLDAALDLPRYIIGDKTRLWQILKNFLDNSAKFTDEGKIVLTVSLDDRYSDDETASITFAVEDTGIGMSEEQLEKIFMPYEQFYSEAQKKYSGTGLGMSISKRLCELMGGVMRIDSEPGKGTSIKFSIPFKRSEVKETELQAISSPYLKDLNILAVDNDNLALDIMTNLLGACGANCVRAHSGADALDILLAYRDNGLSFDLILLDYLMNGLDGLETAKQIQASLSRSPKLLMVTAYQRQLLKEELQENGISEVIEKPFIPTKFIQRLCVAMGLGTDIEEEREIFTKFEDVKALLFEDTPLNQEVAAGMFAQFGIAPLIVENGKEGVELLSKIQDFDIIFMDLQMPVMDGYEATRIIRADPRLDEVPVISLTADAMSEVVDRCLEMGMNDHIAKPIEFANLHKTLLKWLPESKRVSETVEVRAKGSSRRPDPYEEALERFGGDKEFYERGKLEFAKSLPEKWQDFDAAVEDKETTLREVHSIKGASGTLGIMDMYQYAISFESSLRDGNPDSGMYRRLADICANFRENTMQQLGAVEAVILEAGTPEEFTELINRLEEALGNYDPLNTTEIIEIMQKKSWPGSGELMEQIYASASEYDFKGALEALSSVKEELK